MAFEWKDLAEDFSARQRAIVGEAFYDEVARTMLQWEDLGDALGEPGTKPRATSLVASTAPMGSPPASALAEVIISGVRPKCWCAQ